MAKSINGKYVKTYAPGSSEALAIYKLDEIVKAFNAVLAKLDADTGVMDTNYGSLYKIKKDASAEMIPSPAKEGV